MNKETIKKLKEFLALKPENFYMNIVITFTDSHRIKTLSKLDNVKYKNFYFDEIVRITELMKYFEGKSDRLGLVCGLYSWWT